MVGVETFDLLPCTCGLATFCLLRGFLGGLFTIGGFLLLPVLFYLSLTFLSVAEHLVGALPLAFSLGSAGAGVRFSCLAMSAKISDQAAEAPVHDAESDR